MRRALKMLAVAKKLARLHPWPNTPGAVRLFFFVWIGISLVEYVVFGSRSFLWMDDEGDLLVSLYNLLNRFHPGGQYSHLIGSGVDVTGSFLVGGAFFSLDRFLLDIFPLWIGIAIHKALTFGAGAWGTYIACRRGLGCSRAAAAVFGALFTVMYYRLQIVTFGTGTSWALLPLGIYLCVVRSERPRYYLGVIAYAALCAAMFSPFHGIPPLAAALAGAAVLLKRVHFRILLAIGIVVLAVLVNHAETLFGLLAVSPFSARNSGNLDISPPLLDTFFVTLAAWIDALRLSYPMPLAIVLLAGAVFALQRQWTLLARGAAAVAIPPAMMWVFPVLPWELLNMAAVRNAPYSFFLAGILPLAALMGAKAADLAGDLLDKRQDGGWQAAPVFAVLIVAGVVLVQYKLHNIRAWLATAGQSMYATIDNMREKSWMPAEPFRAVSILHKQMQPARNIFIGFYGIPMFDGWVNLVLKEHSAYMIHGVHKDGSDDYEIGLDWRFFLPGNAPFHYRIGEQVSLPLLATANVRFVFSPVPLSGNGLRFVDGPAHPPLDKGLMKITGAAARYDGPSWKRTLERWRWQLDRIFHYGKVYVYEIEGALPRVYAARGVSVAPDDVDWPVFLSQVEKLGPRRHAVVRARDMRAIGTFAPSARVLDFSLIVDGFDVNIDAPDGGVIIVNAAYQPFFSATVDGRPAPLISVNGVQTAVPVFPGARVLKVTYRRPSAGQRIADILCGFTAPLGWRLCA